MQQDNRPTGHAAPRQADPAPTIPHPWSPGLRIAYGAYQGLIHPALPVLLLLLLMRAQREPLYARNLRQRFGGPAPPAVVPPFFPE